MSTPSPIAPPPTNTPRPVTAQRPPNAAGSPRAGAGRFAALLSQAPEADAKRAHYGASTAGPRGSLSCAEHTVPTGQGHVALPRTRDDAPGSKPPGSRARQDDGDGATLAAFLPPPSVLTAPLSTLPSAAPHASSAPARAEAAALAERLVRSMRVGKVGRDGHEVRLRLEVGAHGEVEVRLRHSEGALTATLVAERGARGDAERLAGAVRRELAERGIECEDVEVTSA